MQVCLKASKNSKWYIDSGCSRHMTGDKEKFSSLYAMEGGKVTFGGNQSGRIVGIGEIQGSNIQDVLYVEGLCHNLLSVSQSAEKDNWVIFDAEECLIVSKKDLDINKEKLTTKLRAKREGNCYTVNFPFKAVNNCFVSKTCES